MDVPIVSGVGDRLRRGRFRRRPDTTPPNPDRAVDVTLPMMMVLFVWRQTECRCATNHKMRA